MNKPFKNLKKLITIREMMTYAATLIASKKAKATAHIKQYAIDNNLNFKSI